MVGSEIYALAKRLWPINRSITGDGVRQTLKILKEICPELTLHEVASGTQVFDWNVPDEWNVKDAYIITPSGKKIAELKKNNLHLMGYSIPVNRQVDLEELQKHLHSIAEQPNAIPYVTSYYAKRWGFCITDAERKELKPGKYTVVIDSEIKPGSLTYGEIVLKGEQAKEVLLSTYVCHPSMANNELSGPCVSIHLAKWLRSLPKRNYTYRFVFIPETIGSLTYLSKHLNHLKEHVVAGFNISCVGDNRSYSYLPSRSGDSLSDRLAKHVLKWTDSNFCTYGWEDRGSDERQYCAPGVDLPIASIMRTKFGSYPEYHTSLDDLENVVTPEGLNGSYVTLRRVLEALEKHCFPLATVLGEPQLGKRGLYPTISSKNHTSNQTKLVMEFLTFSDSKLSLLDIAEKAKCPVWDLYPIFDQLLEHGLIKTV